MASPNSPTDPTPEDPEAAKAKAFVENYQNADPELRRRLDKQLEQLVWHDKQNVYLEWAGLGFGFLFAVVALIVGAVLYLHDAQILGGGLIAIDVGAVVTALVRRGKKAGS